ncbi:glycosyltransferase family 2 protein [Streptomyces sp. Wb2n-11]|uniref:glycosyltransferase family 2 protein n=1 Tax=Streptomyces sp. Wb2n-11 TaxID=1030533 RepID=UPI000AD27E0C|nr:glycosyltransferase family 2 protein [Streptomyces sp. Wb2n-11]
MRVSPEADGCITVDSDSCLAPNAVEEVLIPFSRPRVQSVAGIVIATNNRANLLTRVTDLWFVTSQLVDRSGQSAAGAVMVNSGPLAACRAPVIRDNLDSYLNETFMGRPVMFSDDSLMTLYAQERGLTVQQPSAIVFTAMPEKWSHFSRMYLRWMRGSTIRSVWRMRYLSMARPAFWLHLLRWFQMFLTQMVTVWLLVVEPVAFDNLPPATMLWVPFIIGWAQGLRYLGVIRSDERIRSRALTYMADDARGDRAGLDGAALDALVRHRHVCRTGWGTRQNGAEVSLGGAGAAAPVPPAPAPSWGLRCPPDATPAARPSRSSSPRRTSRRRGSHCTAGSGGRARLSATRVRRRTRSWTGPARPAGPPAGPAAVAGPLPRGGTAATLTVPAPCRPSSPPSRRARRWSALLSESRCTATAYAPDCGRPRRGSAR